MTDQQKAHLKWVIEQFNELLPPKYAKGAEENKGNLEEKSIDFLINNAIDEAIDQVVYLLTLKSKL